MIIGEPLYLACLVPVVVLANVLPNGLPRQAFLLAVSYLYYLTFPPTFFAILLAITGLAYLGALSLGRVTQSPRSEWLLFGLIAAALLPLVFYKYLAPLIAGKPRMAGASWQLEMAEVVMPIGISFYTFAAIGYLIDVYLGVMKAERNPLRVGLFTGFFPYVTAGPIPRARETLPQLEFNGRFDPDRAMAGVREILIGIVMKFWIADSLAAPAATVYANLSSAVPLEKLVATVFFAVQLYADFAGYSLIAIGSARLCGVNLPDNFRQPYLSESLSEFWRRWHISLLSWLRDYFYTPLTLHWRQHRRIAVPAGMFATLLLVGIWHGVGWGFLAFGALHGCLMTGSNATKEMREKLVRALGIPHAMLVPIRVFITFTIVALSLVLIRTETVGQALDVYRDIFLKGILKDLKHLHFGLLATPFTHIHFKENIINIGFVFLIFAGDVFAKMKIRLEGGFGFLQAPLYAACVLAVFYQAISYSTPKLFVYFQF